MNKLAMSFLALAVVGVLWSVPWMGDNPASAKRAPDATLACVMAKQFVTPRLKAPSTATFAPCQQPDTIATQSGDTWTVISWVDAQNGFGAMLRADTIVVMRVSDETWTLVDFEMLSR